MVRQHPSHFLLSAADAGGGWDIAGRLWTDNPLTAIPHEIFATVDLWLSCRAHTGPMGGRVLPCAGGLADQPAALMDAFMLLDMWANEGRS